ncbi:MAG: hypothetical protein ACPGWR_15375 [Ardenticatenaceae bacterium]
MTTEEEKRKQDQYDSPWKDVLNRYLPECLVFFFPEVAQQIDWSKGYEFLDKELEQITPQSTVTQRTVDKLVKVFLKPPQVKESKRRKVSKKKLVLAPKEIWLLIHIEVQSQYDSGFGVRMYIYNYRIFDVYGQKVVSLAILGDERSTWRPDSYNYEMLGCELKFKFPIVKLLDYKNKWNELEQSPNPFAVVVMAHLQTQETRHKPEERFEFKWKLIRSLYERGYSNEDVRQLFHFIDWMMKLPEELAYQLDERITEYEEEQKMRYVTSIERHGIQKGLQLGVLKNARKAILKVLQVRFRNISLPPTLVEMIQGIDKEDVLETLHEESITVESVPTFEQKVAEVAGGNGQDSASS